jgi:multicomponent Na+:H+ antiporter subunit E
MLAYIRVAVIFALVYLALTVNVEPSNLVVAGLVGTFVALVVNPRVQALSLARLPQALIGIVRYIIFLSVDIIKCGINVAGIVLKPSLPIRPGIVAVKSGMKTELGTALSAHAITITPGEQVIEIGDDGTMYTHCLDAVSSGAGADAAQANRREMLEKIFD